MATVSIYLNFPGTTRDAFLFYKHVFGTEFDGEMQTFRDAPDNNESMQLSEEDKDKIMHVSLPILDGFRIMGTDAVASKGLNLTMGNNLYINLEPNTRLETEKLFKTLSEGGTIEMPLTEMFWGDYYGSCIDKFGVYWMFNCSSKT